jgi:hypothetical protein
VELFRFIFMDWLKNLQIELSVFFMYVCILGIMRLLPLFSVMSPFMFLNVIINQKVTYTFWIQLFIEWYEICMQVGFFWWYYFDAQMPLRPLYASWRKRFCGQNKWSYISDELHWLIRLCIRMYGRNAR